MLSQLSLPHRERLPSFSAKAHRTESDRAVSVACLRAILTLTLTRASNDCRKASRNSLSDLASCVRIDPDHQGRAARRDRSRVEKTLNGTRELTRPTSQHNEDGETKESDISHPRGEGVE